MAISYVLAPGSGDTDLLLARLAQHLLQRGIRVCGTVQVNTENPNAGRCDMDVQVLPDGPVVRISQSLGRSSRGCRLDSAALEAAVGYVKARLNRGSQMLIVNKFGKQEASGGGFREVIADAVASGIPVIVGLNRLNKPEFEGFVGDMAVQVPATDTGLRNWAMSALKQPLIAA